MLWHVNSGRTFCLGGLAKLVLTLGGLCAVAVLAVSQTRVRHNITPTDPGVRGGGPGAGKAILGLSSLQTTAFNDGMTNFTTAFVVPTSGSSPGGLGPVFNSNQCSNCHSQPAIGGATADDLVGTGVSNPLLSVYQLDGATNSMPTFETTNGPVLVARFPFMLNNLTVPDGTVHQLFSVTGRSDATGCNIAQPNFSQAASDNDLVFREPLPTFGDGLIEIVENSMITGYAATECSNRAQTGICGTPSISPHDTTINRLGWKAQWRGLNLAAGEELNLEMGVTNEYFPTELNQTQNCLFNPVPESGTNFSPTIPEDQFTGDPERMSIFMRFLAPPIPAKFTPAAMTGQAEFNTIGCNICHNVSYTTPVASMGTPLSQQKINLYSDLLLHHMGPCLADGITQGTATGDMFRTPPLWGAGKRAFFLHDGRTSDLVAAIADHYCAGNSQYPASEANSVYTSYTNLTPQLQQDILDFIRDL